MYRSQPTIGPKTDIRMIPVKNSFAIRIVLFDLGREVVLSCCVRSDCGTLLRDPRGRNTTSKVASAPPRKPKGKGTFTGFAVLRTAKPVNVPFLCPFLLQVPLAGTTVSRGCFAGASFVYSGDLFRPSFFFGSSGFGSGNVFDSPSSISSSPSVCSKCRSTGCGSAA